MYQTGYTLTSYRLETASGLGVTVRTTVDTENNTIVDNDSARIFPQVQYDDQGRVITFGSNIVTSDNIGRTVTYNDDGTISGMYRGQQGSSEYTKLTYANGNFASATVGDDSGIEEIIYNKLEYNLSADGTLLNSRYVDIETGQQTDRGFDYTVNQRGLVDSVTLVNVDPSFRQEFRMVYIYDGNSNITRYEAYDESGELIRWTDFTYEPSAEPMPNVTGLMVITLPGFYNQYL